jgi:hypothetical protein
MAGEEEHEHDAEQGQEPFTTREREVAGLREPVTVDAEVLDERHLHAEHEGGDRRAAER